MRRVLLAVATATTALFLASCAGPRNGLNTPASTCFRGLPAAAEAVGHKGSLVGVRSVRRSELSRKLPEAGQLAQTRVCAIAYRAGYAAGDVRGADPAGPGPFAVVVLDTRGSHVLGTYVVDSLPVRFRHRI